jgi:D-serine deaminase-like pyridoxal phosphate-dependent protein
MKIFSLGAAVLAGLFCFSSASAHAPSADRGADESASAEAELLAVHQAARQAHFNRDVDFIVSGMGTEFTTVHEGTIRVMSREDVRKQFTEYFRGAEFHHGTIWSLRLSEYHPTGKWAG